MATGHPARGRVIVDAALEAVRGEAFGVRQVELIAVDAGARSHRGGVFEILADEVARAAGSVRIDDDEVERFGGDPEGRHRIAVEGLANVGSLACSSLVDCRVKLTSPVPMSFPSDIMLSRRGSTSLSPLNRWVVVATVMFCQFSMT